MPRTCKELERQHGEGDCKCAYYRQQFPNCECERCSVSDHSPGLVEDDEPLVRTLYSPHQINQETGEVKPAAFDDARTRGLSVNRMRHISEADLRAKIEAKVAKDRALGRNNDGFWKVVVAKCANVRECRLDDGSRSFCVYDTATCDNASHADVCQAVVLPPRAEGRKKLNKILRHELFKRFVGQPTDLHTAYETSR